jgi:hypothetical protein
VDSNGEILPRGVEQLAREPRIMRILLFAGIALATSSSLATGQVLKFECLFNYDKPPPVVRQIDIDVANKQALLTVSHLSDRKTQVGPLPATITPQKVTWSETVTRGRASSTTTYTVDRTKMSLHIHIDYNTFMDQDPWDQTSNCKARS